MSLSTWFRDYVYIPLGGNRVNKKRWIMNLSLVFVLSGFWHGASWNFIVWGALHACFTIAEALAKPQIKNRIISFLLFNRINTFLLVSLAWIFFRITDFSKAMHLASSIVCGSGEVVFTSLKRFSLLPFKAFFHELLPLPDFRIAWVCLFFLFAGDASFNLYEKKLMGNRQFVFFLLSGLVLLIFGVSSQEQFIYFQF